ncbi:hypothetical protein [Stackebrandtia nassauensis]|uniref:Uncharacterized protein n=1 Tax=Stackebrandtia nassauensis (strain DSM 44728 / CIP 108903 / NRRL B-16338 / NBRC 102104 / LLR-40K-21) TaxID=446470 RepID=D3PX94_STANL|nr:hypothetical protein [Stackebrandtia nassauensis]ADD41357.1 hypothetical protein Snas_1655 [Stackebrandtia nassauensis DSM 44728]
MSPQVILVGANPFVRLFDDGEVTVAASVWIVDWSLRGRGNVLVLWHAGRVRVIGENPELAAWVSDDFTRHFPEAEGLDWNRGEVENAAVTIDIDLASGMSVSAADVTIEASGVLDVRGFATDSFDLGGRPHGLSLVLAPVAEAQVHIGGKPVPGTVRREGTPERPSASAFLTAAEVWTGPGTAPA